MLAVMPSQVVNRVLMKNSEKSPGAAAPNWNQQQPNIFELNVAVKFQRSCYIISPTSGWEMKNRLLIIIYIFNRTEKVDLWVLRISNLFLLVVLCKTLTDGNDLIFALCSPPPTPRALLNLTPYVLEGFVQNDERTVVKSTPYYLIALKLL